MEGAASVAVDQDAIVGQQVEPEHSCPIADVRANAESIPAAVPVVAKGGDEMLHECFLCGKLFQSNRSVNRHLLNIHKEPSPTLSKNRPTLSCSLCEYVTAKLHLLNEHLQEQHQMAVEDRHETFNSEAEFETWKRSVERETLSHFVKKSGDKRRGGLIICYFYCHRSGNFTSKSTGKRNLKGLGTNKINGFCPARIKLTKGNGDVPLHAHYTSTHIGHTCDVGRLRLSNEEKVNIARKLALKVPIDVILDGVRDSVDIGMSRLQLLSRHDVLNIKQAYKLKSLFTSDRPESEQTWSGVDGWVQAVVAAANHCDHLSYGDVTTAVPSPVVIYKPHDELHPQYPKLREEDFLLVLMNSAQKEALLTHGPRLVCADSFGNFEAYNFELTSLLVLDATGESYPVAFIVSSRKDEAGLAIAFESISDALAPRTLHTHTFMSDSVHTYYNAWCGVFGQAERRLLCPWHVDRVWRKRLTRSVGLKGNELQVEVYKTLRCLLMESDRLTFDAMLESSVATLLEREETQQFGTYFRKEWAKRPEAWAQCHQEWPDAAGYDSLVNAHKTLNYILFLEEKKDKGLDRSLHVIMAFARDRLLGRCDQPLQQQLVVGQQVIDRLHERHRLTAYHLSPESVSPVATDDSGDDPGTWNVVSPNETYRVQRQRGSPCSPECPLTCKYCVACIHAFTCTCIDNSVSWNMCAHVHLVCATLLSPGEVDQSSVAEHHHQQVAPPTHHPLIEQPVASHVVEYDHEAFEHWVTSHDPIDTSGTHEQQNQMVVPVTTLILKHDAGDIKGHEVDALLEESKYRYKTTLHDLMARGDACCDHEEYDRLRELLLPVIAEFDDYRKKRQQSTFDILVKETLQF